MNKMAIAGLAAAVLSLTALASQRAAAQCCPQQCQRGKEITFTTGITFGIHCSPKCGHWVPDCPPPCGPYGYPPPPPYGYAANQFQAPMPAPVAAPNPPAPNAPRGQAGAVQSIGYNYPAYDYNAAYNNGYNYGYTYGVPPYWYGSGYGY